MNWVNWIVASLMFCCLSGATHLGPSDDTRPRYALDAFAKELAREYQLEFLNSGLGSIADAEKGIWALNLVSRKQITLDEGRTLANAIAHKLVKKVFSDPLFAQYCQKESPFRKDAILRKEYIAFRLAFWDQNTNRPQPPFLAQIRLADGILYYHFADPETQALQAPIVEALSDLES